MFQKKPWQGADPHKAQYVFLGLDANYAQDIEEKLPEIWDYLEDGPAFWRKTGCHHPFRLRHYAGNGGLYHENFVKIKFQNNEAEQVSFVELLHVPTVESRLEVGDLNNNHIAWLAELFENGVYRYAFIPPSVVDLMRKTGRFRWLSRKAIRVEGDLEVLRDKSNGQVIYKMYHFSCYGWQRTKLHRQIEQVRNLVAMARVA